MQSQWQPSFSHEILEEFFSSQQSAGFREEPAYILGQIETKNAMMEDRFRVAYNTTVEAAEALFRILKGQGAPISDFRIGLDKETDTPVIFVLFPKSFKHVKAVFQKACREIESFFWEQHKIDFMIWSLFSDCQDDKTIGQDFPYHRKLSDAEPIPAPIPSKA